MQDEDIEVDQLLIWIGMETQSQRNAIVKDLVPERKGLANLLSEDMDSITELCGHYNKRNPSNSRFYVPRVVVKSIQDLMLYVQDQDRIGERLGVRGTVTEEEFRDNLSEARERHVRRAEIKKNGKALITTEFQTKLVGRNQWERWSIELQSTLNGIIGVNGVPIAYVIQREAQAGTDAIGDWDEMAIAKSPLEGAKFIQDSRVVHQIISRNIAEESDAYTYIKPNIRKEDGRVDYLALAGRYDNHASRETRINEAKRTLQSIQYRNERSMPFEKFVDKFQQAIDDLEAGGRPMHNDDIIDMLWPKIINNEIREYIVALKVDQARNHRGFRDIIQDIASEIPKISPVSSFKRNVSAFKNSEESKYTKDGSCPHKGVMVNGKIYIGNYTGQKWFDDSVKPYHKEILAAREAAKKNRGDNNAGYKKSIAGAKRKLKKIKAKVKELKDLGKPDYPVNR